MIKICPICKTQYNTFNPISLCCNKCIETAKKIVDKKIKEN